MRTAIVHEWLPVYGGAERVLEQMLHVYPDADLYSLIEFLPEGQRDFLGGRPVTTSFIQRLPFARSKYRYYLPLTPYAIEQFDLRPYEIVISQSYAVAKGVLTNDRQMHLSYVCTPIRYAWDLYFQYLDEAGLRRGMMGLFAKYILHKMRVYDVATVNRVDVFVANSKNVARRIRKTYRRPAHVLYPPVDTEAFTLHRDKEDFYLTASRMVPYKKIDLIVEAFSQMPGKRLVVIGTGPDYDKIKQKAGPNVTLMGYQPFEVLRDHMARARAFVFAAEEDFGIVPVEAQACGTPVIAYGVGGALETVVAGETGLFFEAQTIASLREAVEHFEAEHDAFDPVHIRKHAEGFSKERFHREFASLIASSWQAFQSDTLEQGTFYSIPGREGL